MADHTPPTDQQLDELETLAQNIPGGPWTVDDTRAELRGSHGNLLADLWDDRLGAYFAAVRDATLPLVVEVRSLRFRIAELGDQGPDDRETVAEAAQMYRSLRPVIERTMTDPDRWDGDESEEFHLGRYVEWLAAERAQVRAEVLTEASDKLDRIGHAAAAWILRDDASRPAAVSAAVGTADEQQAAACGKCRTPFNPADTRHDGHARSGITSFCRRCVDRCHESTDAFHVCAVCREGGE